MLAFCVQLNDACDEEVLQVQSKYNRKRQPLYSERADVIRTVPGFWRRALVNHGQLSSQLTDEDLEVLAYCMEVRAGQDRLGARAAQLYIWHRGSSAVCCH